MSRIYWDSMLFVYWLEAHPAYAARVEEILRSMVERGDRLCVSHLSMGEVLTGPLKHKHAALAANVRQFFDSGGVELLPLPCLVQVGLANACRRCRGPYSAMRPWKAAGRWSSPSVV